MKRQVYPSDISNIPPLNEKKSHQELRHRFLEIIIAAMQAQAVIVATEDGTTLTITMDSGPVAFPGGIGTVS